MASYSPFKDYFAISGSLFSDGANDPKTLPQRSMERQRTTSVSSVETDNSDDTTSCLSNDSVKFYLPHIPELTSGRPILPQRRQVEQRSDNAGREEAVDTTCESDASLVDRDTFDREEMLSSACSFPMDMTPSMERIVTEVVERKIRDRFSRPTVCVFCQRNGETIEYYSTHLLKDNRGKVICPVLRKYVCPKCHATGDNAHTLRHCPLSRNQASVAETFNTPRTSCGFRKF